MIDQRIQETEACETQELETYRVALNRLKYDASPTIPALSEQNHCSLSIHNHVLSHDECLAHFMFFKNISSPQQMAEYRAFERKIKGFFRLLFESTPIFVAFTQNEPFKYKRIKNYPQFRKYVVHELRKERNHHDFLLPEYRTLIRSNFDLTWPITRYTPFCEDVLAFAREAGVHILGQ